MSQWIGGVVALLVTLTTAPVVRRWLISRGLVDRPNARSSHSTPTPRGGGIAAALGVALASTLTWFTGHAVPWAAIAASFVLAIVGLTDDWITLHPIPRLAMQVLIGLAIGLWLGGPALAAVGAFVVPVVVNMVNFMDGVNGITSMTLTVWGGVVAVAGALHGVSPVAAIGGITAGAALGFLPWNAPTARLFLGDVGSYLFGGLAAVGIITGVEAGLPPALLIAPLALYFADTGVTIVRRAVRGERLTVAHRSHTYQRLVSDCGLTHTAVAALVAAVSVSLSFAVAVLSAIYAITVSAVLVVGYLALPSFLRVRTKQTVST